VEDKKYGLPRIKHLRAAPAAIRFLSIEPLLENLEDFDITGIDWAIVGGESGHGARPMEEKLGSEHPEDLQGSEGRVLFQAVGWSA
jgi:protein gp37